MNRHARSHTPREKSADSLLLRPLLANVKRLVFLDPDAARVIGKLVEDVLAGLPPKGDG